MQKSFSEITSLAPDELSAFIEQMKEPLLVTNLGQPQFVAQSLAAFETMVRRLRTLERQQSATSSNMNGLAHGRISGGSGCKVIPFRK
jgi:PHD/YefM family antitoxin component YafN of YafNO toxin-antitoxin module